MRRLEGFEVSWRAPHRRPARTRPDGRLGPQQTSHHLSWMVVDPQQHHRTPHQLLTQRNDASLLHAAAHSCLPSQSVSNWVFLKKQHLLPELQPVLHIGVHWSLLVMLDTEPCGPPFVRGPSQQVCTSRSAKLTRLTLGVAVRRLVGWAGRLFSVSIEDVTEGRAAGTGRHLSVHTVGGGAGT